MRPRLASQAPGASFSVQPFAKPSPPRRRRRGDSAPAEARALREEVARLRAELAHAARWNAMGLAAAALAHELNQPLTASSNFLEAARYALAGQQADAVSALALIDDAALHAQQAGAIVRNLREFIDKHETGRRFEDLNQVVEGAMALGAAVARQADTRVERRLVPGLPLVLLNRVEIQQVLVNLCRNAVQAMREMPERVLTVATAADPDGFVRIAVSDTGPGIAPGLIARLFQPFATTKRDGMGLGLRISQSIVEAHGGQIRVRANKRRGATFEVRLPIDTPDVAE